MSQQYKYFAFISYSRKDSRAAAWLQKRLEWFRFPVKLVPEDRRPPDARYVRPIYRDKTNLEVTDEHYWKNIRRALEESRYLIVLASPDSAMSNPVDMEVSHFLANHDHKISLVVPVILGGNIMSADDDAALGPTLRALGESITTRNLPTMVPDVEATERDGWEQGFVALVSYLLHLDRAAVGDHLQRAARRQARVLRTWLVAVGALFVIAVLIGMYANRKRHEAVVARDSANDLVGFMLTDLHDQLAATGRLDALLAALTKVDTHLAHNPTPPDMIADLRLQQARILFGQGEIDQAVGRAKQSLSDLSSTASASHRARLHAFLGDALAWQQGKNDAARQECMIALSLFDEASSDPVSIETRARTQLALGDLLRDDQQPEACTAAYEQARLITEKHAPNLDAIQMLVLQRQAEFRHWSNDPDGARRAIESAMTLAHQHLLDAPKSHPWLLAQARTLLTRSVFEVDAGQISSSLHSLRAAEVCAAQTATPGQLDSAFLLEDIRCQLAAHPSPELSLPERYTLFRDAIRAQQAILRDTTDNRGWEARFASNLRDRASFYVGLGELFADSSFQELARADLDEAERLLRPIDLPGMRRERSETLVSLAEVSSGQAKAEHLASALALLGQMPEGDVETLILRARFTIASSDSKDAASAAHQFITQAWQKAVGARKSSLTDELATSFERLASLAVDGGDAVSYKQHASQALALRRQVIQLEGDQPDKDEKLALALSAHARCLRDLGEKSDAAQNYEDAARICKHLTDKYPNHAPPFRELALAQYQLGKLASESMLSEKALALFNMAFTTFQTFLVKASLEGPHQAPPIGHSNLKTLMSIVSKEAGAAFDSGHGEIGVEAWCRLLRVIQSLKETPQTVEQAAEMTKIRDEAASNGFDACVKLDHWPQDQDGNVRLILNELANSRPEAVTTTVFLALKKRLERAR